MNPRRWTLAAFVLLTAGAHAATVKVGIVGPFSGPFAHYGKLFKDGVEAYVAAQGGKLAGHDVRIHLPRHRRPESGPARATWRRS